MNGSLVHGVGERTQRRSASEAQRLRARFVRRVSLSLRVSEALILCVLCLLGALGCRQASTPPSPPPLPQTNGTIAVMGLTAPVRVVRDRAGVPHIYASNTADLFVAQGFVQT